MYSTLADLVVVLHFAFILFVVFGALLVWRYPRVIFVHLPAATWGAIAEFGAIVCPLTYLENHLRDAAGGPTIETTFIEHYLVPIVYPPSLSYGVQIVLGTLLVSFNAFLYYRLWRRRRHAGEGTGS